MKNIAKWKPLAALFATAVLAAGCVPTPEENEKAVNDLTAQDSVQFKQAGFEIVTKTGIGACRTNGELTSPGIYNGTGTDIAYLLKRPGHDDALYAVCMYHSDTQKTGTMMGLKSVDRPAK